MMPVSLNEQIREAEDETRLRKEFLELLRALPAAVIEPMRVKQCERAIERMEAIRGSLCRLQDLDRQP